MLHGLFQLLDLGGCCPLLRSKDTRRATLAAQGVVHVGQEGETAVTHGLRQAYGADVGNLAERFSAGKQVTGAGIKEFGAQSRQDAHRRVAGGRASQSQDDVTAATLHRVAHDQARAVGRRPHHIALCIGQQRQTAGGGYLDEGRAIVTHEIGSVYGRQLQQRAHRGHRDPLSPASRSQHHGCAVATVGDRDTAGRHALQRSEGVKCCIVELLRRRRALELIKCQDDAHQLIWTTRKLLFSQNLSGFRIFRVLTLPCSTIS